jgi:hypothetical protein
VDGVIVAAGSVVCFLDRHVFARSRLEVHGVEPHSHVLGELVGVFWRAVELTFG